MHTARDVWWLTAVRPAMLGSHAGRAAGGRRAGGGGEAGAAARGGGGRAWAGDGVGRGGGAVGLDEPPMSARQKTPPSRSPVPSERNITRFHLHKLGGNQRHSGNDRRCTEAPEALHTLPTTLFVSTLFSKKGPPTEKVLQISNPPTPLTHCCHS